MNYIDEIPFFSGGKELRIIEDGWSDDIKIVAEDVHSNKFVCRLSDIAQLFIKQKEFHYVQKLNKLTDMVPKVYEVGTLTDHNLCYIIYEYVEGVEAGPIINHYSEEEQVEFGRKAGKLLKIIHSIPVRDKFDIYFKIKNKLEKKKIAYKIANIREEKHDLIVSYLDAHLELLKNRPTVFCHGDFHLGNMLINEAKELKIIDFNRCDLEDPYQDFNRMLCFGRRYSIPFTNGQINGYFDGEVPPEEFFNIISFYASIDIGFGYLWAMKFGEDEIKVHNELKNQLLNDFEDYRITIPRWYQKEKV